MKKIRKMIQSAILIMLVWLSIGTVGVGFSDTPEARLFVNPTTSEATTCALHTITVRVEDVVDLTGSHLEVDFDPAVVNVTQVENGGFLDGASEGAFYEPTNAIDNTLGKIVFGMVQQNSPSNPMTPKTGTGDLIIITMQVVGVNQSTDFVIDAAKSMLVDWPDAYPIDFVTTAGEGTVTTASCPPTDILLSNTDVPENEPVGTVVGAFSAVDPDLSDTHTFSLVQTGLFPDNAFFSIDGNVLKTSAIFDFEDVNTYTIRVRATDNWGASYEEEFTITITDVNEAPTAVDDNYSTLINQTLVVPAPGVLSNDTDPEGDTLVAIKVTDPTLGTAFLSADGELTYYPPPNIVGVASFTYRVYDGSLYSEAATVTIQVNQSNEAPTDINLSNTTIEENKPAETLIGVLSTVDPDIPNDAFTYTLVSGAGDVDNAAFTIAGDQLKSAISFDYEMKDTYTIRVRSTDQGGLSVEKAFTISILDVNEAPLAYDQSVSTDQDTSLEITLTGFDEDGDAFSFALISGTTKGLLMWTPPKVTYVPNPGYVGFDSFEFKAIDAHGLSSTTATITIEVLAVNHAPTDINLSNNTLFENSGVNAVVGTLTTEDPDIGDTFTYSLIAGAGAADNASFNLLGDQLRASEDFDYETRNSYTIRVRSTDQDGLWVEKVFTITILDVNEPPIAYDQAVSTAYGTPLTITLTAFDEDGDPLTYAYEQPAHGTLSGVGPELTYTPDQGFSGTDSFTFTVSDSEFESNVATVTIEVAPRDRVDNYIPVFYYNSP